MVNTVASLTCCKRGGIFLSSFLHSLLLIFLPISVQDYLVVIQIKELVVLSLVFHALEIHPVPQDTCKRKIINSCDMIPRQLKTCLAVKWQHSGENLYLVKLILMGSSICIKSCINALTTENFQTIFIKLGSDFLMFTRSHLEDSLKAEHYSDGA